MKRIVLDGLPLAVHSAGVATYTRELSRAMATAAPDSSFALFQPPWPRAGGSEQSPANLHTIRSWRYPLVMGQPAPFVPAILPLESAVGPADLFHGTAYCLPRRCRIPMVATVHDLALLRHPELGNSSLRAMVTNAVHAFSRADRLIAVSRATRDDLVELCGIDRDRIDVVANGCASFFAPLPPEQARETIQREVKISGRYLLHVGTIEPRKNLPRLIKAYARLRRESKVPHKLVLAGANGWEPLRLDRLAANEGVADRVLFPGRVPQDLLRPLYAGADVFVYPSLYEGFGLPVLEAMACGTPVVTSNVSALPEVAGGAAVLVDPGSVTDIAAAIQGCLQDRDHAQKVARKGLARAAEFSWSATARATLATYRRVLDGNGR